MYLYKYWGIIIITLCILRVQKKTPVKNAAIAVTVLHTVMRDCAPIVNNATIVIAGPAYRKEVRPFTT